MSKEVDRSNIRTAGALSIGIGDRQAERCEEAATHDTRSTFLSFLVGGIVALRGRCAAPRGRVTIGANMWLVARIRQRQAAYTP